MGFRARSTTSRVRRRARRRHATRSREPLAALTHARASRSTWAHSAAARARPVRGAARARRCCEAVVVRTRLGLGLRAPAKESSGPRSHSPSHSPTAAPCRLCRRTVLWWVGTAQVRAVLSSTQAARRSSSLRAALCVAAVTRPLRTCSARSQSRGPKRAAADRSRRRPRTGRALLTCVTKARRQATTSEIATSDILPRGYPSEITEIAISVPRSWGGPALDWPARAAPVPPSSEAGSSTLSSQTPPAAP